MFGQWVCETEPTHRDCSQQCQVALCKNMASSKKQLEGTPYGAMTRIEELRARRLHRQEPISGKILAIIHETELNQT